MNTGKTLTRWARALAVVAGLSSAGLAQAAGLLTPSDGSLPPLEFAQQHVEVVIEDGYAVTTVEQVFHNPHRRDLEATYSFPSATSPVRTQRWNRPPPRVSLWPSTRSSRAGRSSTWTRI